MAIDRFGRRIHYLRISLTDHCNLRCIYCMPEDFTFRPNIEIMQDDEILILARLFAGLGFDKFRLTGGEPTVRANIVDLVSRMAHLQGVRQLTMTTNGLLLPRLAQPLAAAGLQRVNISLDTLNPEKYKRLTRWGAIDQVWAGIEAAEQAGLTPLKINVVVVRGYNERDVCDLAHLTLDHRWQVRFIEAMPFAGIADTQPEQLVTAQEVQAWIEEAFGPLALLNNGAYDGEAHLFQIPGARGSLGFITSITQPFCNLCSRARLTADGRLRLCLLRDSEVDLLTPLRSGATLDDLRQIIIEGIWTKPWGHGLADQIIPKNRLMSEIGG